MEMKFMPFEFIKTRMDGLVKIKPHIYQDNRGVYIKYYDNNIFAQHGLPDCLCENSEIMCDKGTLRGLHYQERASQGKLIHVVQGKIYDVAVDLRKDSKTFGQWEAIILSGNDTTSWYIPEGFAHGFLTLEDHTIFSYQSTCKYYPQYNGGIIWNDKRLNITWPIEMVDKIIISDKDSKLIQFDEYLERLTIKS